jgi:DNA-binding NarL/FixJ family response regulator
MATPITILLVDDHVLVRQGLAAQINAAPDMHVCGEAGSADAGIELVEAHKPGIVLMDIDMPGMSCFSAAKTIQTLSPESRVIFLSAYCYDGYIDEAIRLNAAGYVTKGECATSVLEAIRIVAGGGVYFSDDIKARIVIHKEGVGLAQDAKSRLSTLTPREREVLRYLARGMGVKETASVMHLSVKTVDNHKANLMAKLDIHDRVELARFAIREGFAEA